GGRGEPDHPAPAGTHPADRRTGHPPDRGRRAGSRMTATDQAGRSGPAVTEPVVAALRRAFHDRDGNPVAVRTRPLTPAELGALGGVGPNGLTVLLPDSAELTGLLPGERIGAAAAVGDHAGGVLLHSPEPVGTQVGAVAAAVRSATAGLAETVG